LGHLKKAGFIDKHNVLACCFPDVLQFVVQTKSTNSWLARNENQK